MRQYLGEKKVKRLREKLHLPIKEALVRGNTNHAILLVMEDGSSRYLLPGGILTAINSPGEEKRC